jgi:hypothetical protein
MYTFKDMPHYPFFSNKCKARIRIKSHILHQNKKGNMNFKIKIAGTRTQPQTQVSLIPTSTKEIMEWL